MFGIMMALPLEAQRIVPHRMRVGDTHPLSDNAVLIVTGIGESSLPIIRRHAESGQFSTLISMGTGVGLSPLLTPGTICIPDEVAFEAQTIRCHHGLQTEFIDALKTDCRVVQKRLIHTSHVITTLQEKEDLYQKTQAVIADMESFIIGQEAFRYQLNFLSIRVVVDSIHLHMPPALLECCLPSISFSNLMKTVCKQPHLLPTLLAFSKYFKQAQHTLKRVTEVELLQTSSSVELV